MVLSTGYNVNHRVFDGLTDEALAHFRKHGFATLSSLFTQSEMEDSIHTLDTMRARFAEEMELDLATYDERICQWRDMWMFEPHFDKMLRDERLIGAAQFFMQQPSIQLIHDHVIRKPFSALNATIP